MHIFRKKLGNSWLASIVFLGIIMICGAFLRWQNLAQPQEYLFDEHYHIPTAKFISRGDVRAFEFNHGELTNEGEISGSWIDWLHPPLHKYWQALNIKWLGEDNPLAWRLSAAISGIALIGLSYWLVALCFGRPWAATITAALIAFDPLLITQSRIGMNDMMVNSLMVLTVICWLYWAKADPKISWRWWIITAVVAGLAVGTKWSAMLILPLIIVLSLARPQLKPIKERLIYIATFCLVIALTYLLIYLPFFIWGKNLVDFYELNVQIFRYQVLNNLTHPAASTPLEWVLGQKEITLTTRPEQYANPIILKANKNLIILNLLAFTITSSVILFRIFLGQKKQKWITPHDFKNIVLLLSLYLWAFTPWLFSPRPMFLYHYFVALPYIAGLNGFWIDYIFFLRWRES